MGLGMRFGGVGIASMLFVLGACAGPNTVVPSGMRPIPPRVHALDTSLVELARAAPRPSERSLLVVFPPSVCSGSSSAVFTDDAGRFFGAVVPGTAALLTMPEVTRIVTLFSSVEVTAPLATWHDAKRIDVPPSPSGILVRSLRWSGRDCWTGQYVDVTIATKAELEIALGEPDLRWLEPAPREGQGWLDAHRSRVAEVLSTPAGTLPSDRMHLLFLR